MSPAETKENGAEVLWSLLRLKKEKERWGSRAKSVVENPTIVRGYMKNLLKRLYGAGQSIMNLF